MNTSTTLDAFRVLGVRKDASEADIRAGYLELVKLFPPEREPEKFREIQSAFEAANDPLLIARRLLDPPSDDVPSWSDAIEEQKRIPPSLTPALLLSLGNRDASFCPKESKLDGIEAISDQQETTLDEQRHE